MVHHVTDVVGRVGISPLMCKQEILQCLGVVGLSLKRQPAQGIVGVHVTLKRTCNTHTKHVDWKYALIGRTSRYCALPTHPISRLLEPVSRARLVPLDALTLQQHDAVVVHRLHVAVLGALAVELGGGAQVPVYALRAPE